MRRGRRRFVDLPLAGKLTVLMTATSAMSMIVICTILGNYQASALRLRLVTDTERLLNSVGVNSAAALLFRDERVAEEIARTVALDKQVLSVAFLLPDGHLLARYERPGQSVQRPAALQIDPVAIKEGREWHAFTGQTFSMTRALTFEGEMVGTAYVVLDLSELNAGTLRLWRIVGCAWVGTSLAAALLGWRLQRIVSRPLLRLAEISREVIETRDLGLRATKGGNDEVGELVDRFNEMLGNIQHHEQRLAEYQHDLERMVETRTAQLTSKTDRYRMLLESTHAVPWEVDVRTFTLLYIAPQITRMSGFDPETIVGGSAWELVHPQDRERLQADIDTLLANPEREIDVEYRHLTVGRDTLYVRTSVSLHCLESDGSLVLRGITVDVTRQRKLEMELRQAQKLESVGRLAAGVAHEINTPVQFVSDSVRFVRDSLVDLGPLIQEYRACCALAAQGALPPAARAVLDKMEETADIDYVLKHVPKALDRSLDGLERVAVIVRSMKEFAHPDQKEMAPVDLNQAIQATLTIARNEYKYIADVETDLADLPLVTCHGGEINQVVLNLLVNAVHAIEDRTRGTDQRGCISVQTRRVGDTVAVKIGDTGNGIPDDIRGQIFDPFFTTKGVGRGTGQGLAIARTVVLEKHGGSLTFETETGVGTVFTMCLPVGGRKAAA
jgi:PAS domain S-box-containing protein